MTILLFLWICLVFALGRAVWKDPKWNGPKLGPKPADLNEREFTEDQLKAGQTIIGLQAGQNKGATQAGRSRRFFEFRPQKPSFDNFNSFFSSQK